MLDCLTFCAFIYWALVTIYTILPLDAAVCGAEPERGELGALLHNIGGEVGIDAGTWRGYPCNSHLVARLLFILQRPGAAVAHIMTGGSQGEPFVPVLFMVPTLFIATMVLREGLGVRTLSPTASRTLLKLGIAVGCRAMVLAKSLLLGKSSLYYKRESNLEFFIIAWTGYSIEIPVLHEAAASGGTALIICAMAVLCPHHFLPEVNPANVALQAIAATVFVMVNASHQQRRRQAERDAAAAAARSTATRGPVHRSGSSSAGGVADALRTMQTTVQTTVQTVLANQAALAKRLDFVSRVVLVDLKRKLRPPSSGYESRGSNQGFCRCLMKSYGMTQESMRCMVLDKALPAKYVVAGHLFPMWLEEYASDFMGSDFDINGSQNGVLWNSAIEVEFEHQRICFSKGPGKNEWILHVLDKSLLPQQLSSVGQHRMDPEFARAVGNIKFKDLHNKRVVFESASGKGPYKRALAFHARVALDWFADAYPDGFDPSEYLFDDQAEHDGKEEFVQLWLKRLIADSITEVGPESSAFPEGVEQEVGAEEEEEEEQVGV